MSDRMAFIEKLDSISVGKRSARVAPHKPLYILFCIGVAERGEPRLQKFETVRRELGFALRMFGRPDRSSNPEYPFWRLQNDGLAEVVANAPIVTRKSNTDPTVRSLLEQDARGGLLEEYHELLKRDFGFRVLVVRKLLDKYFPRETHDTLLRLLGIHLVERQLDDYAWTIRFRDAVIAAYGGMCAFSGFSAFWEEEAIGVVASPIFWSLQDQVSEINGAIALSSSFATLYQTGLLSIDDSYHILVSPHLKGAPKFNNQVSTLSGSPLKVPPGFHNWPDQHALELHRKWVFKR